jgi:hypothetical protein
MAMTRRSLLLAALGSAVPTVPGLAQLPKPAPVPINMMTWSNGSPAQAEGRAHRLHPWQQQAIEALWSPNRKGVGWVRGELTIIYASSRVGRTYTGA